MEPIVFFGSIPNINTSLLLGGDGARVVFDSMAIPLDRAEALKLAMFPGKLLHVRIYLGDDSKPYCEFDASIPVMDSSVAVGKIVRVKFDVPATDKEQVMLMAGVNEQKLRIVVDSDGKSAIEEKAKPEPTPYGKFWQYLDRNGFFTAPDMRGIFWQLEEVHGTAGLAPEANPVDVRKAIIRLCFGVDQRSTGVSPAQLRSWLVQMRLERNSSVYSMIRNAEAFAAKGAK
jgi:hypothetical protein